jgi:murein DD-endopeptidase MepM/ murein hydrolase activator NlpD
MPRLALGLLSGLALAGLARAAPSPERLPSGVALPYPTAHVFRGFGRCRGERHRHEAIDLGGVGPDGGLGTPVRSMVRAEIVMIGSGHTRPREFGRPLKGRGKVVRGGRKLPRTKEIPGYGEVHFFTLGRGKWRSGTLVETLGLEPPLAGHRIRYLHLGAVRPDLGPGDVVMAGEEIGLLGGTGVQMASPHVHIDIRGPADEAVDVAPLIGLPPTARCGEARLRAEATWRAYAEAAPTGPPPSETWPVGPVADPRPALVLDPPLPSRAPGARAQAPIGAGRSPVP